MSIAFHGSDLEKVEERYGIRKEEIVGFGANVNPLGLSPRLKEYLAGHLDVLSSYPDREYRLLREAISAYTGADASEIMVGNGSTELISSCIRAVNPPAAIVLGPSYSEYERELELAGSRMVYYDCKPEEDFRLDTGRLLEMADADRNIRMLVMCNPNNPTSSALLSGQLAVLLEECRKREIFVMVDETYAEFAPRPEEITAIPLAVSFENLMVLRGVSKFWAAPGLRLGYGVTGNAALRARIRETGNPWTVSSLADAAGQMMFSDQLYIEETRSLINAERERCIRFLFGLPGLKVYPAYANFVLVRILKEGLDAAQLFEAAIRRKMMIRDCASFHSLDESFFRFCFMLPEDNTRLLECIADFVGSTEKSF